jgi:hypothetical protein
MHLYPIAEGNEAEHRGERHEAEDDHSEQHVNTSYQAPCLLPNHHTSPTSAVFW